MRTPYFYCKAAASKLKLAKKLNAKSGNTKTLKSASTLGHGSQPSWKSRDLLKNLFGIPPKSSATPKSKLSSAPSIQPTNIIIGDQIQHQHNIGKVEYYSDSKLMADTPIVAAEDVQEISIAFIFSKIFTLSVGAS